MLDFVKYQDSCWVKMDFVKKLNSIRKILKILNLKIRLLILFTFNSRILKRGGFC
uniref:Uncharacterized protein n=1 Tax=Podoviridae sp. ctnCN2 TaxID=2825274 RepID=A0A8S5PMW8_9CAUD|nr:MAG TPA: hypothetical protein [Podoviridae sp. ctnCN2]